MRPPRPTAQSIDYYTVLKVSFDATTKEIRAAFKRLMIEAHPDKNPHRKAWSERRVRELITAFEVLADPKRRAEFDLIQAAIPQGAKQRKSTLKRHAEPYFFRRQDPESRALRVLYHLTHRRPREAVRLLDGLETEFGARFLRENLEREDYLDTLFLLAEYHTGKRCYRKAAKRLMDLYLADKDARYPRPYLPEVLRLLKDLYIRKIPGSSDNTEAVEALAEARELDLTSSEEGARLCKLAEIQLQAGNLDAAKKAIAEAERQQPLSKNVERIRKMMAHA